eukprot:361840-Chlamydomonas_euryale.AAC.2
MSPSSSSSPSSSPLSPPSSAQSAVLKKGLPAGSVAALAAAALSGPHHGNSCRQAYTAASTTGLYTPCRAAPPTVASSTSSCVIMLALETHQSRTAGTAGSDVAVPAPSTRGVAAAVTKRARFAAADVRLASAAASMRARCSASDGPWGRSSRNASGWATKRTPCAIARTHVRNVRDKPHEVPNSMV